MTPADIQARQSAIAAEREAFNRWYDETHGVLGSQATRQEQDRHVRRLAVCWEAWKARASLGPVSGHHPAPKNPVAGIPEHEAPHA